MTAQIKIITPTKQTYHNLLMTFGLIREGKHISTGGHKEGYHITIEIPRLYEIEPFLKTLSDKQKIIIELVADNSSEIADTQPRDPATLKTTGSDREKRHGGTSL